MSNRLRRALVGAAATAVAIGATLSPFGSAAIAQAAPAASAFGARVQVGGEDIPPTPAPAVSVATPTGDATDTVIDIPAQPVIVNGTLTATANAHSTANIASGLTVVQQQVAGPYHARGLAQIEGASVLYGLAGEEVPLLSAALIRSEAAVVCGATNSYTANSEIIDLEIGGEDIPLNAPVQDLIDAISGVLTDSGLAAVADVKRNVVTQTPGGGIGVDALVVTVLAAIGETPLAQVRLAHADVSAAACPPKPACSDTADNDGDGKIDAADPGCHSDGNAANAASYEPLDNDETNSAALGADTSRAILPRTGSETDLALAAAALATAGALVLRLRRRLMA